MKIEQEIRQSSFTSSHQKAVINLLFTTNWVINKQQKFFKPFGITPQQFNILRILKGQHPNGISGTEIKSRMLDKNSDISRLLDRLVQKQLTTRVSCPQDKRATNIFITTDGLALLDKIQDSQHNIDFLLALSPSEADQLSDLLDRARG